MNNTTNRIFRTAGVAAAVAVLSLAGGYLGARLAATDAPVAIGAVGELPESRAMPASFDTPEGADVSYAFQSRFRQVAADTLPVVVEVNTLNTVTQRVPANPFSFLFGESPKQGERTREYQQRGLGSGVLVARDRDQVFVLTNNHVAGEADEIEVVLNDGRSYRAELVGSDELLDLALVSFSTDEEIPIARLGNAESLEIGDWVFAVGNPLGFQSSVTAGIVSAKERSVTPRSGMSGVTSYIQTDASINQGNSGGALVNLDGEVVGINTWIASRSGGSDGIGFAIPINIAQRAVADFIERGEVAYSWLGVMTGDAPEELRSDLGAANRQGAFVHGVYQDSPAERAGLAPGDLVVRIGTTTIESSADLVRTIAALPPGADTPIAVMRDGEERTLSVETSLRDTEGAPTARELWPGVSVLPVTDQLRQNLQLERDTNGVVVAGVTEGSVAAGSGLRRGDVIVAVNGSAVDSAAEFYAALRETEDELQFRVLRDGNTVILGFLRPVA